MQTKIIAINMPNQSPYFVYNVLLFFIDIFAFNADVSFTLL